MNMPKSSFMHPGGGGGLSRSAQPPPPGSACDTLSKRADSVHAPQPRYEVDRVGGFDHKPLFRAVVTFFPDGFTREGLGNSKMEAKRTAASAMLELLRLRRRRPAFFGGEGAVYEDRAPGEGPRFEPPAPVVAGGLRGGLRGLQAQTQPQFSQAAARGAAGSNGGMPSGGLPPGGMPLGGPPPGGIPQGGLPPGGMPQGGPPSGGMPQGAGMGHGPMQGGMPRPNKPNGMLPLGAMPPGGMPPSGMLPSGTLPNGRVMGGDPNNISIAGLPQSLQESIRQYQNLPQHQQAAHQGQQKPESLSDMLASMRKNQSFMQHLQSTVGPNPLALPQEVRQQAPQRVDPRDPHNRRQAGGIAARKVAPPSSQPAQLSGAVAPTSDAQPQVQSAVAQQAQQKAHVQAHPVKAERLPVSAQPDANRTEGQGESAAQIQSNAENGNDGTASAGLDGAATAAAASVAAVKSEQAAASLAASPSKPGSGSSGMLSKKKRLLASADPVESPAIPSPAIVTPATTVDVSAADGGGFGEMPAIAIPRKRARTEPPAEAVQPQTGSPALAQPQHQQPATHPHAPTTQHPPQVAQQGSQPETPLTALLFVYIDDQEAMRATVNLAGSAAASQLDLQVRAFGPSRAVLTKADAAVPSWMQVTRVEPSTLDVNVAFAAGRDACQFESGGGRIIVVSSSGMLSSLAVPGVLDIVQPAGLDRHLTCLY